MFLTIILTHIGVVLLLLFAGNRISIGMVTNCLLSEGILMIPTLLFLLAGRRKPLQAKAAGGGAENIAVAARPFEAAAFHKVKVSTLLMIVLCTFLLMPLVAVLNALSMLFADNVMGSLRGDIVDMPFPMMLFMIGIVGPFCEEFVFRGVLYRSYRRNRWEGNDEGYRTGRREGVNAVLLSAFLFGLMHMNFNQMIYAFAMGIFLALFVEAAGSLWASVFCHMFFNSAQVVLMFASRRLLDSVYGQTADGSVFGSATQELLAVISVYLVIAAVTTPVAGCVLVWIAKNEGRQQAVLDLFLNRRKRKSSSRPTGRGQKMRRSRRPGRSKGIF